MTNILFLGLLIDYENMKSFRKNQETFLKENASNLISAGVVCDCKCFVSFFKRWTDFNIMGFKKENKSRIEFDDFITLLFLNFRCKLKVQCNNRLFSLVLYKILFCF